MYDEILLPTDGSPGAQVAIDHAIHAASQNDAILHAAHVAEVTELGDITSDASDPEDELREGAREVLAPILDAADGAGVEAREVVLEGTPHEELVSYAEDTGIDMIVMGTHGKRALSRVLLGSTAENVVRNAPVPVLTVRAPED